MAYRQMAEAVPPHQRHAVFQIFMHVDRERVVGHYLSHTSTARVKPFRHHALHQITFGKNTDQSAMVYHGHGADILLHHDSYNFQHCLSHLRLMSLLVLDQIADTHLDPPSVRFGTQKLSRGATICRNDRYGKGIISGAEKSLSLMPLRELHRIKPHDRSSGRCR